MKTTGRATSFVTGEDQRQLRDIERLLGHAVPLAPGSSAPSSAARAEVSHFHRNDRSSPSHVKSSGRFRRPNSRGAHAEPSARNTSATIRP
jgi:ATP-dependent RNA helicase RhlE